jgi:hypothetical protein
LLQKREEKKAARKEKVEREIEFAWDAERVTPNVLLCFRFVANGFGRNCGGRKEL